ncbi:MAG: tRNA dihydrouridine(20/20a) synthase DusA [Pseudomonadota bacterium]
MYARHLKNGSKVFAVAPMMDWTDRHCRFFHRQLSRHALLYSEMVTADAVIHGDRERLISFDKSEHPVALQLGGSDPAKLAEASRIGEDYGYDEINLNCGCPSDRVQNGTFGAVLMREPDLVGRCLEAMRSAVQVPVTIKCRLGVDEQDTETALDLVADRSRDAGADAIWVHARKAWLQGLSPKENRDIPPLDYDRVYRLKERLPDFFIGINGGIQDLDAARNHFSNVDGVMLGRAAYQHASILIGVDAMLEGREDNPFDWPTLIENMIEYANGRIAKGDRLSTVTRHMIGLFHGVPGARRYRQVLSEEARGEDATTEVIERAFEAVGIKTRGTEIA